MTAETYKLCFSDTPAQLASEVTELLSQGWELYGYPFADGRGDEQVFCQAMVWYVASRQLAKQKEMVL